MKKLSLYIFLCLLLKGCGEPATKIYPKNGMFTDKNKTYDLHKIINKLTKITPDLFNNDSESSSANDLLSSENDEQEDDLEIPAFLRRQKN